VCAAGRAGGPGARLDERTRVTARLVRDRRTGTRHRGPHPDGDADARADRRSLHPTQRSIEAARRQRPRLRRALDGTRVVAPVLRVSPRPLNAPHGLVDLLLDDGRRVLASPGHPLADGRDVAALAPADGYDGARVAAIASAPFSGTATCDLLPAGPTGIYWADGVPLASTLGR
jgi:hypothetical protein